MTAPAQYQLTGATASEIAANVEEGIRNGLLAPGETLESVRQAAKHIGVSPATVASAYRMLRDRGLVITQDRSRTRISARPPVMTRPRAMPALSPSTRDLTSGNPDPALLPDLRPILARMDLPPRLYGETAVVPELLELARDDFESSGIVATDVSIVSGGLGGLELALEAHLRPGHRVAVEDPCYTGVLDLVRGMGFVTCPVAMDEFGMLPHELERVASTGIQALIITPRNQNPTGAALSPQRAAELRSVMDAFPGPFVIEDDHASGTTTLPRYDIVDGRQRWALIRSVTKALGPDLRLAMLTGDPETVARVEGRQMLGSGWVSHILQRLVLELRKAPEVQALLRRAAETYDARRTAFVDALRADGVEVFGRSGFNVWIPVAEEEPVLRGLLQRGWAVRGGEAYRVASPPGIRVTTATLEPDEAVSLAADVEGILRPRLMTRSA